jgi:hypothetical protein
MRRFLLSAVLGLLATAGPASAQWYPPPDYPPRPVPPWRRPSDREEDLARYWYKSYFRRPAYPQEVARVSAQLRAGERPAVVLARLLGGREYFDYSGGTREGLLTQLILDVGHHKPVPGEVNAALRRTRFMAPRDVAYSFLLEYPQNWVPGLPGRPPRDFEGDYDYRRPDW